MRASFRGGELSVDGELTRLEARGLIASVLASVVREGRRGERAPLYYPTDLGLAALSLGLGADLKEFARTRRLSRRDFLGRLLHLRPLLAAYELLGALVEDQGGEADLAAWEAPWRQRVTLPRSRATTFVSLPAYARLRFPEGCFIDYFLLPDLGTSPTLAYATALSRLTALQAVEKALPALIIAAPDSARVRAWRRLLSDIADRRLEAPLASVVTTWSELRASTKGKPKGDPEPKEGARPGAVDCESLQR